MNIFGVFSTHGAQSLGGVKGCLGFLARNPRRKATLLLFTKRLAFIPRKDNRQYFLRIGLLLVLESKLSCQV